MNCLTEETALAFIQGELRAPTTDEIANHLNSCSRCRRLVADAATALFEDEPPGSRFDADVQASVTALPGGAQPGFSGILVPGTEVGRYKIVDLIAVGAMGTVYRAYDPRLGRQVALKVILAERGSAATIGEAEAMARLSDPHVVGIHDAGTIDNHVFVVMELIEGDTLSAWLKSGHRSWRDILAIFLDAGSGLAAAHAVKLVHGDFKPDNVLVGKDGRGRVTDFGLAATALPPDMGDHLVTPASLQISGTPAYMSPEQFLGHPAGHLTDQFSYCLALYVSLYGRHPFLPLHSPPKTMRDFMNAMTARQIEPPSGGGAVPVWLFPVIAKGLEKRPEDRFSGMPDLLAEIEHNLTAKPPEPARAQRRKVAALLAALGLATAGFAAWRTATRSQQIAIVTPACGNGHVEQGEECDDGNRADDDGCLTNCRFAKCGDGKLRKGVENCDDGNLINGDGCDAHCVACNMGKKPLALSPEGHCYWRDDTPMTWEQALAACKGAGAELMTFHDLDSSDAAAMSLLSSSHEPFWISLSASEKGEVRAVNNSFPPSNVAREVAIAPWPAKMCGTRAAPQTTAPFPCDRKFGFLCETDSWITAPKTNHAYMAFFHEATWEGAQKLCEHQGAHLATITTMDELVFLQQHFPATYWLGARRLKKSDGFSWITGEPFSAEFFATGEPNVQEEHSCAVLADTTHISIVDRACDGEGRGPYGVICEID